LASATKGWKYAVWDLAGRKRELDEKRGDRPARSREKEEEAVATGKLPQQHQEKKRAKGKKKILRD